MVTSSLKSAPSILVTRGSQAECFHPLCLLFQPLSLLVGRVCTAGTKQMSVLKMSCALRGTELVQSLNPRDLDRQDRDLFQRGLKLSFLSD